MKSKRSAHIILLGGFIFWGASYRPNAAPSKTPTSLTPELAEELASLPRGLSGQPSLFIRRKHVESVQYSGAGQNSRFSFQRGRSLIPQGLSLLLTGNRREPFAGGFVQFKEPLDVQRYNSLVLWAHATHPDTRILIGMKDAAAAKIKNSKSARTNVLPIQGFPAGEPVQLVIPLSRFLSKRKINLSAVRQITFEFGKEEVGNTKEGMIEIFGFAFVEQTNALKDARVVLTRSRSQLVLNKRSRIIVAPNKPAVTQVSSRPANIPIVSISSPSSSPSAASAEPVGAHRSSSRRVSDLGRTVKTFVKMNDLETTTFFRQLGFDHHPQRDSAGPTMKRSHVFPISFSRDWIQPYARLWPASAVPPAKAFTPVAAAPSFSEGGMNDMLYYLALGVLFAVWLMVRRRRVTPVKVQQLGKMMHEIHWPFLAAEPSLNRRVERDFWKGVAAQQVHFGWLSAAGVEIGKTSNSEYFGESFLRRQIRYAARAGVHVFPSLSFTDTIFRRGAFASNPERAASALKTLATDTLMRFTDIAPGARIENTALLLGAKLRRRSIKKKRDEEPTSNEREFMSNVIATVKAKHPGFIFIADAVGAHAKRVREIGFDYFENEELPQDLISQIRTGSASGIYEKFSEMPEDLLKHSIFNMTPLIQPLPRKQPEQEQNFLAAVLLALLPGVIQHDDSLPVDLGGFITRISRVTVLRKGSFLFLQVSSPSVLAFARWHHKSLYVAVANFSTAPVEAVIKLDRLQEGMERNKLYLFNNAMHGASALKNLLHQDASGGPAMALWGQNLQDVGLPLNIPGLSLSLFSVSLTRPITTPLVVAPTAPEQAAPALTK